MNDIYRLQAEVAELKDRERAYVEMITDLRRYLLRVQDVLNRLNNLRKTR
jgi:hypothetical protein